MRDKHYKSFSFRLNDITKEKLINLKKETGLSYNLLFTDMIKIYKKRSKKDQHEKKFKKNIHQANEYNLLPARMIEKGIIPF